MRGLKEAIIAAIESVIIRSIDLGIQYRGELALFTLEQGLGNLAVTIPRGIILLYHQILQRLDRYFLFLAYLWD